MAYLPERERQGSASGLDLVFHLQGAHQNMRCIAYNAVGIELAVRPEPAVHDKQVPASRVYFRTC
jgi:hypothetical protein